MSHIIYYVLALTFSLLGLQLKKPAKAERANVLFKITERIQSDKPIERELLNLDCTLLERDIPIVKKRSTEKSKCTDL